MAEKIRCCNCEYGEVLYGNTTLDFYCVKCVSTDERADRTHTCDVPTKCEVFKMRGT